MNPLPYICSFTLSQKQLGELFDRNSEITIPARTALTINQLDEDLCAKGLEDRTAGVSLLPAFKALLKRSFGAKSQYTPEFICDKKADYKITFLHNACTLTTTTALKIIAIAPPKSMIFDQFIWDATHSDATSTIEVEPRQVLWIRDIDAPVWSQGPDEKSKQLTRKLKMNLPQSHKLKIAWNGGIRVDRAMRESYPAGMLLSGPEGFSITIYKNPYDNHEDRRLALQ